MKPIWSIEVRHRTIQETPFVCPRCGLDRDGSVVEPQRWFTVLHLPLVPLATLEHVVACATCGHQAGLGVLEIPTGDVLAAYLDDAIRHAVATTLRTAEAVSDRHREAAVAIVTADGRAYDTTQLAADLVGLDDIDTADRLRRLAPELTAHGKQAFLHRMAALARSDGPMSEAQQRALVDMGVALQMSAPHINGVIAVATLAVEQVTQP